MLLPYCKVYVSVGGVQTLTMATELFMVIPETKDKLKGLYLWLESKHENAEGNMFQVLVDESNGFYLHCLH